MDRALRRVEQITIAKLCHAMDMDGKQQCLRLIESMRKEMVA